MAERNGVLLIAFSAANPMMANFSEIKDKHDFVEYVVNWFNPSLISYLDAKSKSSLLYIPQD